ncbi:polysaccharide pyruvyl transferase family protein [Microbacterium sp. NPDC064584]|uniref:polysaccharide pyruvyl transferase family protein n=1 Tax=Microbacterium sp. NPDC064584 TaxID=3155817 RepID=UPI003448BC55
MTVVRGVDVVHWNPRVRIGTGIVGKGIRMPIRVNNFGDLLGPVIVERLAPPVTAPSDARRLITVGSILQFARDGDVVWGTGVNGKLPETSVSARSLDVRAVRGPLTAAILRRRGISVPEVYGDPGLLIPSLLGISRAEATIPLTSVPNLNEFAQWRGRPGLLNPRMPYRTVIETIARSAHVVASSLHAIIIADVLGVPVSPVLPRHETVFKYEDYYEGTGRNVPLMSDSFESAVDHVAPPLSWSDAQLRASFPTDMWARQREPDPVEG